MRFAKLARVARNSRAKRFLYTVFLAARSGGAAVARRSAQQMTCVPDTSILLKSCAANKPFSSARAGRSQALSRTCVESRYRRSSDQGTLLASNYTKTQNNRRSRKTRAPRAAASGWDGKHARVYARTERFACKLGQAWVPCSTCLVCDHAPRETHAAVESSELHF